MERKAKWTRGPVWDESGVIHAKGPKWTEYYHSCIHPVHVETEADAALVVAAFNAATACEDMDYDGEACVNALPELVKILEWAMPFTPNDGTIRTNALAIMAKCRG